VRDLRQVAKVAAIASYRNTMRVIAFVQLRLHWLALVQAPDGTAVHARRGLHDLLITF
jgi:hypothetical protein